MWEVIVTPSKFEKIFGYKEKTYLVKDTGEVYTFGGGAVYVTKDGDKLSNGHWIAEAIDKHRRKW